MDLIAMSAAAVWLVVHMGAIAAAWGTRISVGSPAESVMRTTYFAALATVGLAAWIYQHFEFTAWLPSGLTLIAMVLTAVADCRDNCDQRHTVPAVAA